MINIVIPMAGLGSRFQEAGYEKPKPFIDVLGKPMIARVMENLSYKDANYILLARSEHLEQEKEIVEDIKAKYNVQFVTIDKLTEGAACTVLYARKLIDNDTPLLIANSDQIVDLDIGEYIEDCINRNLDGSILTFKDHDTKWSYAKIDELGHVTMVREKECISEFATVGLYLFARGKDFVDSALDMIVRNDRVNNEFYVCPVYNYFIQKSGKIGIYNITQQQMHGIGTPKDLDKYMELIK